MARTPLCICRVTNYDNYTQYVIQSRELGYKGGRKSQDRPISNQIFTPQHYQRVNYRTVIRTSRKSCERIRDISFLELALESGLNAAAIPHASYNLYLKDPGPPWGLEGSSLGLNSVANLEYLSK